MKAHLMVCSCCMPDTRRHRARARTSTQPAVVRGANSGTGWRIASYAHNTSINKCMVFNMLASFCAGQPTSGKFSRMTKASASITALVEPTLTRNALTTQGKPATGFLL